MIVLALMALLALNPAVASAKHVVHLEVTVEPGVTYHDTYDLAKGEVLSNAWTSDLTLKFYLTDPSGEVIRHSNGTGGQEIVEAESQGNYTLNWENIGDVPTSLISDSTTLPTDHDSVTWIAVLAVIVALIALIVAVVAIVIRRERK